MPASISASSSFAYRRWPDTPTRLGQPRRRSEKAGQDGTVRVRARDLAYLYIALGRTTDALDQFERALDERDPSLVWLTVAPRVDPLRKEPRFQAILQKIGLD